MKQEALHQNSNLFWKTRLHKGCICVGSAKTRVRTSVPCRHCPRRVLSWSATAARAPSQHAVFPILAPSNGKNRGRRDGDFHLHSFESERAAGYPGPLPCHRTFQRMRKFPLEAAVCRLNCCGNHLGSSLKAVHVSIRPPHPRPRKLWFISSEVLAEYWGV